MDWRAGRQVRTWGRRRLLAVAASPHLRRDGEGNTCQWKGNRLFLVFPVLPTASWGWLKSSEFCIHTRDRKKSSSLRHASAAAAFSKKAKGPPLLVEIPNRSSGEKMLLAGWLQRTGWHQTDIGTFNLEEQGPSGSVIALGERGRAGL